MTVHIALSNDEGAIILSDSQGSTSNSESHGNQKQVDATELHVQAYFSKHDDDNDFSIAELAKNCIKSDVDLLSIVIDDNDNLVARKCCSLKGWRDINPIICLDHAKWIVQSAEGGAVNTGAFDRQVLAFGDGFLDSLSQLRITIVGAGATGSATAILLARHSAHFIAIVDPDHVVRSAAR